MENGEETPTKKEVLRDVKGLESGKHNGKIIVENFSPKLTGGSRKIVDDTFKDSAKFKDDINGEISE
jgi:hypothetical protein